MISTPRPPQIASDQFTVKLIFRYTVLESQCSASSPLLCRIPTQTSINTSTTSCSSLRAAVNPEATPLFIASNFWSLLVFFTCPGHLIHIAPDRTPGAKARATRRSWTGPIPRLGPRMGPGNSSSRVHWSLDCFSYVSLYGPLFV